MINEYLYIIVSIISLSLLVFFISNYCNALNSLRLVFNSKKSKSKLSFFDMISFLSVMFVIILLSISIQAENQTNSSSKVLFMLDVSKSMDAIDDSGSRLEIAKMNINELLKKYPQLEYALICFADKSVVQIPFTRDFSSFINILNSIETDNYSFQGTNFNLAFQQAAKVIDTNNTTIVYFLSDGESNESLNPGLISKLKGVNFFAQTIGSPKGANIIDKTTNTALIDEFSKPIITKSNPEQVQRIAGYLSGKTINSFADVNINNLTNQKNDFLTQNIYLAISLAILIFVQIYRHISFFQKSSY